MSYHIYITLDKENCQYNFRHASELESEAKGGYLKGTITVKDFSGQPCGDQIESIELDLVEKNGEVHPTVLYVNRNERKERASSKRKTSVCNGENSSAKANGQVREKQSKQLKPTIKASDCLVVLLINGDTIEIEDTSYVQNVTPKGWNCEESTLSLGKDGLRLTVVKPNQKGQQKSKSDMFIQNVLDEKKRKMDLSFDIDEKIARFSSKRSKESSKVKALGTLFAVHLKVVVNFKNGQRIEAISEDPFIDKGKYHIEVKKISPDIICSHCPSVINILMATCKASQDISFNFYLENPQWQFERPSVYQERGSDFFCAYFDPLKILPQKLDLVIKVNCGANMQFRKTMEVEVREHTEGQCWGDLSIKEWSKWTGKKGQKRVRENDQGSSSDDEAKRMLVSPSSLGYVSGSPGESSASGIFSPQNYDLSIVENCSTSTSSPDEMNNMDFENIDLEDLLKNYEDTDVHCPLIGAENAPISPCDDQETMIDEAFTDQEAMAVDQFLKTFNFLTESSKDPVIAQAQANIYGVIHSDCVIYDDNLDFPGGKDEQRILEDGGRISYVQKITDHVVPVNDPVDNFDGEDRAQVENSMNESRELSKLKKTEDFDYQNFFLIITMIIFAFLVNFLFM